MLSYRNALCALALTTLMLAITSMEQLRAGELVQFDAVSADAGSPRLLGYLARPRGPQAGPFQGGHRIPGTPGIGRGLPT